MRRQRPFRLRQASAYFRLAAKFERAGQVRQADHYRDLAERRVREHQAQKSAS